MSGPAFYREVCLQAPRLNGARDPLLWLDRNA